MSKPLAVAKLRNLQGAGSPHLACDKNDVKFSFLDRKIPHAKSVAVIVINNRYKLLIIPRLIAQ